PGNGYGRIVGGEDASKAQFPHQISLRNGGSHSCGGSIISKNFILTAAHCVTNQQEDGSFVAIDADRFTIRAGSNDRFSGGVLVNVVEVIFHEGYNTNLHNDVAVLRLESPLIFSSSIQPIALPSVQTPDDADIIVSGWGRLKAGGDLPRYLQYNTLKSISFEKCDELIGWGLEMELCLLHEADNGVCHGDSGGPAIYNGEVVGIAGFVWGSCGTTYPDGYSRVWLSIQAGSNDRFRGGVVLPVAEIIVHEDYGKYDKYLHDIALLRLERPLIFTRNIQPIALASSETPDDVDIVISGWGRLETMGRVPRYLQYNTVQSISFEKCDALIGYGFKNMLCLHHEVGNGACEGDSGGPAVYNNELVGVAGFVMGGGCGTEYPDGYARVYYYVDWIKKHSNI
ncbi:hypothetical protein KR067_001219, partial [Drosophila pandora]